MIASKNTAMDQYEVVISSLIVARWLPELIDIALQSAGDIIHFWGRYSCGAHACVGKDCRVD